MARRAIPATLNLVEHTLGKKPAIIVCCVQEIDIPTQHGQLYAINVEAKSVEGKFKTGLAPRRDYCTVSLELPKQ